MLVAIGVSLLPVSLCGHAHINIHSHIYIYICSLYIYRCWKHIYVHKSMSLMPLILIIHHGVHSGFLPSIAVTVFYNREKIGSHLIVHNILLVVWSISAPLPILASLPCAAMAWGILVFPVCWVLLVVVPQLLPSGGWPLCQSSWILLNGEDK